MSPTTNGTTVHNTLGSDVRASVRVAPKPSPGPQPPNLGDDSARTRAIPLTDRMRQGKTAEKIRDFLSPHVKEIGPAVKNHWTFSEQPPSVRDRARAVIPAKGEARHPALWPAAVAVGVICVLGTVLGQLIAMAFATRARGAVATAVLVLTFVIHEIAQSL